MFDTEKTIWLGAAALATLMLAQLMRHRQVQLMLLLQAYVEKKLEWSRKRARAAKMAQAAAMEKARTEAQHAALLTDHEPEEDVLQHH
jgi:hypothetical protein